jgi:RNA polymerase sigma factor (TIGR02999 family)
MTSGAKGESAPSPQSDAPSRSLGTSGLEAVSSGGNGGLLDEVYGQLRAIAQNKLANESAAHTLQATALVHEAWLKLCQRGSVMALDRTRFVIAAAEAMRRVLIDHSRARGRIKRGAGAGALTGLEIEDVVDLAADHDPEQILALDGAICRLEQEYAHAADVVKLRFFAGLGIAETAQCLGVSERTVKREWRFARAWLFQALS